MIASGDATGTGTEGQNSRFRFWKGARYQRYLLEEPMSPLDCQKTFTGLFYREIFVKGCKVSAAENGNRRRLDATAESHRSLRTGL